jgi:hypothetical protein
MLDYPHGNDQADGLIHQNLKLVKGRRKKWLM